MFSLITSRWKMKLLYHIHTSKVTVACDLTLMVYLLSGKVTNSNLNQKGTGTKCYNMRHRSLCTANEATVSCSIEFQTFYPRKSMTLGLQQLLWELKNIKQYITSTDSQQQQQQTIKVTTETKFNITYRNTNLRAFTWCTTVGPSLSWPSGKAPGPLAGQWVHSRD